MAALRQLTLDLGVDPWERHSGETPRLFALFCAYRDMGRTRTLRKTAEKLSRNPRYIYDVSVANQWVTRVEAYDRYRDHLGDVVWAERRALAAEHDATLLDAAMGKVAGALTTLKVADLDPALLIRLLDVTMRARRALYPVTANVAVAVSGPAGEPLTVQLAEFASMSTEQRRQAVTALLAQVARRSTATNGDDDDG